MTVSRAAHLLRQLAPFSREAREAAMIRGLTIVMPTITYEQARKRLDAMRARLLTGEFSAFTRRRLFSGAQKRLMPVFRAQETPER